MRAPRSLALAAAVTLAACGGPPPSDPPLAEGIEAVPAPRGDERDPRFVPGSPEPPGPEPSPLEGAPEEPPGVEQGKERSRERAGRRATPYVGLGAWVDIYDDRLWGDPERTVARLARRGVRTLFLQTTSYRRPGPIRFPNRTSRFIEAAHDRGLGVVGWYLPGLDRMRRDLARSAAAARFATPRGDRFDSFALDIEATEVADPLLRAARAVELSRQLRAAVGPEYPLGAITPSPLRGPHYWPVLPVRELGEIYDVILPMAYWDAHASGRAGAHAYIARGLDRLRAEGGEDVPVHVIGGVAEDATPEEVAGFVAAVRERRLVGASIYDVASMRPSHWEALKPLSRARWRKLAR